MWRNSYEKINFNLGELIVEEGLLTFLLGLLLGLEYLGSFLG